MDVTGSKSGTEINTSPARLVLLLSPQLCHMTCSWVICPSRELFLCSSPSACFLLKPFLWERGEAEVPHLFLVDKSNIWRFQTEHLALWAPERHSWERLSVLKVKDINIASLVRSPSLTNRCALVLCLCCDEGSEWLHINLWFAAFLACKKKKKKNPFSFCASEEVTEVDRHSGVRGSRWAITPIPTESKVTSGWKTANLEGPNPLRTQSRGLRVRGGGASGWGLRSCTDVYESKIQESSHSVLHAESLTLGNRHLDQQWVTQSVEIKMVVISNQSGHNDESWPIGLTIWRRRKNVSLSVALGCTCLSCILPVCFLNGAGSSRCRIFHCFFHISGTKADRRSCKQEPMLRRLA